MLPPLLMSRNCFHYRFAFHDFAFIDPNLDANDTVDRMGFGKTVVDVRPDVGGSCPSRYHSVRASQLRRDGLHWILMPFAPDFIARR